MRLFFYCIYENTKITRKSTWNSYAYYALTNKQNTRYKNKLSSKTSVLWQIISDNIMIYCVYSSRILNFIKWNDSQQCQNTKCDYRCFARFGGHIIILSKYTYSAVFSVAEILKKIRIVINCLYIKTNNTSYDLTIIKLSLLSTVETYMACKRNYMQ